MSALARANFLLWQAFPLRRAFGCQRSGVQADLRLLDLDEAHVSFRWLANGHVPTSSRSAKVCSLCQLFSADRRNGDDDDSGQPQAPTAPVPMGRGVVLVVGERCCFIGVRDDS